MTCFFLRLVSHLELAVVDVAVGQGEVDDVIAGALNVEVHAVGRGGGLDLGVAAIDA